MRAPTLRLLLLLLSPLVGCIDLEGAFNTCVDTHRCHLVEDAGVAVPDAGYDGGLPCAGSPHQRLRCDAPIDLLDLDGGPISGSAMVASNRGFIVGWASTTAEVREVHLDRTSTPLVTGIPIGSARIALDARGDHWVAAWATPGASSATYLSSASDAGVDVAIPGGGPLNDVSVATNSTGAVALAVRSAQSALTGSSSAGFPAQLTPLEVGYDVTGVAVVSTSDSVAGFRYVVTSPAGTLGSVGMLTAFEDGGVRASWVDTPRAPGQIVAVASTSGAAVLSAYVGVSMTDEVGLGIHAAWANHASSGTRDLQLVDPGWWSLGTCGEGCVALGVTAKATIAPAMVSFFSDDSRALSLGAWDVECDVPPRNGTDRPTISVATFGGRLGVLLTRRTAAQLYVCDLPPLAP